VVTIRQIPDPVPAGELPDPESYPARPAAATMTWRCPFGCPDGVYEWDPFDPSGLDRIQPEIDAHQRRHIHEIM
jgi:hypothetical protein